ncbi:MAG: hypothetical protein H7210_13170 [Pyrinomonadaceae bacterium]|nr:hypothetical protein [Phycisphaerales bacterium]
MARKRLKGEYRADAGPGMLLLPLNFLVIIGQVPDDYDPDASDLKEDEGYNERFARRFCRLWFTCRKKDIPAIMASVAYWQARRCGYDPRHPYWAKDSKGRCCYPEDGEMWKWWSALQWKVRARFVRDSIKAGVGLAQYKRRRTVMPTATRADPSGFSLN